jgi:GDP-mannose transporter
LLNKAALSSFDFKAPDSLLFFQCALCVVLVRLFALFGYIKVEPFNWNIVRVWYPSNLIFVGMIITSFWALKDLGVATVTVLKNMTNLIVVSSEYFLYGRVYNSGIWATMGLMVLSAVVGGFTDLSFSASGYFWQMVNSAFTAANMLYLKVVMEKVKKYTSNGERLDEFSMVFYNNLLSLPLIFIVMVMQGELTTLPQQTDLTNPAFLLVASLSGLVAFGISFSVLWFLSTTTPTTFSLVGSLNKIPVSFIGLILYESTWSLPNLLSICIGLASGVMFVIAKQRANG